MLIALDRQSSINKTNIISYIFIKITIIINDKQELNITHNSNIIIFINKNKSTQYNFITYSTNCIRINNEFYQGLYKINKIKRFIIFIIVKICIKLHQ
jgi:hypothetical protein